MQAPQRRLQVLNKHAAATATPSPESDEALTVPSGLTCAREIEASFWDTLSPDQQVHHFETEGFLVLPDLLSPAQTEALRGETAELPLERVDYSPFQKGFGGRPGDRDGIAWRGGELTCLLANSPTIGFLSGLFGGAPVAMHYGFAVSEPGHPGILLHCDGQPWGSAIFGNENTCPRLVRTLYMLDELDSDVAPFKCIPRSHLAFHEHGNPCKCWYFPSCVPGQVLL